MLRRWNLLSVAVNSQCLVGDFAAFMMIALQLFNLLLVGLNGDSKITDTGILFLLDKNCNFEVRPTVYVFYHCYAR